MLHNVTELTKIVLNFHKSKIFFLSKEFFVDKNHAKSRYFLRVGM